MRDSFLTCLKKEILFYCEPWAYFRKPSRSQRSRETREPCPMLLVILVICMKQNFAWTKRCNLPDGRCSSRNQWMHRNRSTDGNGRWGDSWPQPAGLTRPLPPTDKRQRRSNRYG